MSDARKPFVLVQGPKLAGGYEPVCCYFGDGLPEPPWEKAAREARALPAPESWWKEAEDAKKAERRRRIEEGTEDVSATVPSAELAMWEDSVVGAAELVIVRFLPGGGHLALLRLERLAQALGKRLVVVCPEDHWAAASVLHACKRSGAARLDGPEGLVPFLEPYLERLEPHAPELLPLLDPDR